MSSTELARHEPTALAQQQAQALAFSEEQRGSIKTMIGSAIKTEVQFQLFLATAESLGLNPLAREIHGWTDRRDEKKLVVAIGIDGFRKKGGERAAVEGIEYSFAGADGVWRDVWLQDCTITVPYPKPQNFVSDLSKAPVACRCRIYLRGARRAIEEIIYTREFYVQSNPNWNTRLLHMLKLRAEGHCWKKIPNTGLGSFELLEEGAAPPTTITEEYAPALAEGPSAAPEAVIYDTPHQPEPEPQPVSQTEPVQEMDFRKVAIGRWQQLTGTRGNAAVILQCLADALNIDLPAKSDDVTPMQWQAFDTYLLERGLPQPKPAPAKPTPDHQAAALALYDSLGGNSQDEGGTLFDLSEALDSDIQGRYAAVTPAEWERFHAYLQEQGIPGGKSTPSGAETLNL